MSHNHWELRTHCKNGHEYTPETVFMATKDGRQYRACRICSRRTSKAAHQLAYYGITEAQRDAIFVAQGSCCAVCKAEEHGGRGWHTDHDHATKQVRGILCHACNLALGNVNDSVEILLSLIEYLKRNSDVTAPLLRGELEPSTISGN